MSFRIAGTGMYVPENIVTNDDLSKLVETNDEWIRTRVGIERRHISVDETTADMAVKAAEAALENSGIKPEELDLILVSTVSGDYICPTVACLVQQALGVHCLAYDISAACSAFLFLLETAAGYFARGTVKKALVIGAERMSRIIDWSDRSTCVIFGDGAGAAVLEEGDNYLASHFNVQGGAEVIRIPASAGKSPFYKGESLGEPYVFMNGQETFKFAVNSISHDIKTILEKAGMGIDDIKYVVPHQANLRIIDAASRRSGIPLDKFYVNIQEYGNTSSASIPMALDELNRAGKLERGDNILFTAFGGGLASAASIIRW